MLFVELRFLPFFALVLLVHWALRWHTARKWWLLAASYVFYGAWDWRFLGLIIGSTVLDWVTGARIHAARGDRARQRRWLTVSLVGNLGVLGFYKYWDFFAESAAQLTAWLGMPIAPAALDLILPVGISFYTFQTLSYSLDIYRGQLAPAKSPLDLALFVAFFPQLVAGPIVLAREFLPQLEEDRRWARDVDVKLALALFFIGFVKKSCIADNVAPLADAVFAAPGLVSTADAWLGLCAFVVQIYGDFSGYSDMAIATALLLGYRMPRNFDFPYLARSVGEFWTRWHITLGRWFRDYLYIPLGGNRGSALRTRANLMATMAVSGLWHGASWTMVLWGLFHGTFLVLERSRVLGWVHRLPLVLGALYTTLVWTVSMAFFRAESLADTWALLGRAFVPSAANEGAFLGPSWAWPVLACLALVHIATRAGRLVERWTSLPAPLFAFTLGALVAFALPWVSLRPAPYLYFAF
jgi:alginate O-acetyltransferase complex protein AlgI